MTGLGLSLIEAGQKTLTCRSEGGTRMRRDLSLLIVLALLIGACGGPTPAGGSAPSPTPLVAGKETVGAPTPTAAPTPTPAPTVPATPTPRPTPKLPLLVEWNSDADVEEVFNCLPPTEIAKLQEPMTKEDFQFPIPFNPRGTKGNIQVFTRPRADGVKVTSFVVTILDGSVTVKSYMAFRSAFGALTYEEQEVHAVVPLDQSKPRHSPGGTFYPMGGGKGVVLLVTPRAELLDKNFNPPEGIGKPIFKVSSTAERISAWANGHMVIVGLVGTNNSWNSSPITADSLQKRDGKIVCIS